MNLEPVKAIKPVDIPLPKPVIREQRTAGQGRKNGVMTSNTGIIPKENSGKSRGIASKKENPVWRTVQNLQVAKAKEELERLDKHLNGLDKSLSQQIQKAKPDNTEQAKIVLKPGETHAMNFLNKIN